MNYLNEKDIKTLNKYPIVIKVNKFVTIKDKGKYDSRVAYGPSSTDDLSGEDNNISQEKEREFYSDSNVYMPYGSHSELVLKQFIIHNEILDLRLNRNEEYNYLSGTDGPVPSTQYENYFSARKDFWSFIKSDLYEKEISRNEVIVSSELGNLLRTKISLILHKLYKRNIKHKSSLNISRKEHLDAWNQVDLSCHIVGYSSGLFSLVIDNIFDLSMAFFFNSLELKKVIEETFPIALFELFNAFSTTETRLEVIFPEWIENIFAQSRQAFLKQKENSNTDQHLLSCPLEENIYEMQKLITDINTKKEDDQTNSSKKNTNLGVKISEILEHNPKLKISIILLALIAAIIYMSKDVYLENLKIKKMAFQDRAKFYEEKFITIQKERDMLYIEINRINKRLDKLIEMKINTSTMPKNTHTEKETK